MRLENDNVKVPGLIAKPAPLYSPPKSNEENDGERPLDPEDVEKIKIDQDGVLEIDPEINTKTLLKSKVGKSMEDKKSQSKTTSLRSS